MLSVKWRQRALALWRGLYTGKIDGIAGKETRAAVRAFQTAAGLVADGIYGAQTDAALCEAVKTVQRQLNVCGCDIAIDALAGNSTAAAVKSFQQKNALAASGIADKQTLQLLAQKGALPAGYISPHFKKSEFACCCGGKYCDGFGNLSGIDRRVLDVLECARSHFGKAIHITSGVRCKKQNAIDGGVSTSRHMRGKAADCYIGVRNGVSDKALCSWFKSQSDVRYSYTGFGAVHFDVS